MRKLIFAMALLIASCVTTKISSNKAPDFNGKIKRLYIVAKGADEAKSFFVRFYQSFGQSLKTEGIVTEYYYFDPLSLEGESSVISKIEAFSPNMVMMINQTEARNYKQYWSSSNTGGTFDIRIQVPESKNPIWRANLKADASMGLGEAAQKASNTLLTKLKEDQML